VAQTRRRPLLSSSSFLTIVYTGYHIRYFTYF